MAKVGILTFHWADDFGAMLQAYGLKKYLMDCGHEVTIIPYSNSNLYGRYRLLPKQPDFPERKLFVGDYNLWEMARNIKHLRTFILRRNRMKYFRKKYLVDKNFIVRHRQLDTTQYDAIIIGSDQVWNPEITVGLDRTYLGNFKIRKDSKVISYAASIGGDCLTHKDAVELGRNIDDNFSAVSVRE